MKNKTEKVMCAGCGLVDSKNSRDWLEVELLGRLQNVKTGSERPMGSKTDGPFCSQSCALEAQKRLVDQAKEKAEEAGIEFHEVSLNSKMASKIERQDGMMARITYFVLKCMAGGDPEMDVLNDLLYDYQDDLAAHPEAAIGSLVATGWLVEGTLDHRAVMGYIGNIGSTTREQGLEHATMLREVVVRAVKRRTKDMPMPEELSKEFKESGFDGVEERVRASLERIGKKRAKQETRSMDEIHEEVRRHVSNLNPGFGLFFDESSGIVFNAAHGEDGTIILNEMDYDDIVSLFDRCAELLTLLEEKGLDK